MPPANSFDKAAAAACAKRTRAEQIEFCRQQAEACRAATCDETLPAWDRVGAQLGELDWLTAEAIALEGVEDS